MLDTPVSLQPMDANAFVYLTVLLARQPNDFRWSVHGSWELAASVESMMKASGGRPLMSIVENSTGRLCGISAAYFIDRQNCVAHVAVVTDATIGLARWAECVEHFARYLFSNWPFRKLYLLLHERKGEALVEGGRAQIEGRLRNHSFLDGSYDDLVVVTIDRPAADYPDFGPAPAKR